MITSVFRKSTPLNFSLVVLLVLAFFIMYQFQDASWMNSPLLISKKTVILVILMGSVFLTNFIAKKNGLSKDSSYTILFYFLFIAFFPDVLDNINLIIANFCVLLALRRLISLQSLKSSSEKIFDASLWIFVASLFHFWSILYLVLVFISIIFHVARDFKNWVLPFIAFFAVAIISLLASLIFEVDIVEYLYRDTKIDFTIDYFTNNYQNAALSIYATVALFFVISLFATLSARPQLLQTSFKKVIGCFFIGIVIYVISPNKSNDVLLLTVAPLAIMATSHIEMPQVKLKQEMVLFVLMACSLFVFFSQL